MPAATATRTEPVTDLESTFTDREFEYFSGLVYDVSGIVIGPHKRNMMFARLVRRVRELGLASFADYCALVRGTGGEAEIGALINAMTTNLTRFFREEHHFEFLSQTVLPQAIALAEARGDRRVRLWSAGCSSGEEPYSIAIALARALAAGRPCDARILATDIDTSMVARAAEGRYAAEAIDGIPSEWRNAYFDNVAGEAAVQPNARLKELISFRPLNLMEAWPMRGPFDAIFCRNVMIYFDAPTKTRLVDRLTDLLRPDGWLFLGHSETLLDRQHRLRLVGRTIYRRTG